MKLSKEQTVSKEVQSVNSWLDNQLSEIIIHHPAQCGERASAYARRASCTLLSSDMKLQNQQRSSEHKHVIIQSMLFSCHRLKGGEQKRCMDAFDGHLHSVRVHGFSERRIGMFCTCSPGVTPHAILGTWC